jgi:type IV pilus assembly protein PilA
MVMVIMIGVLVLLGLRLYTARQQQKAKNAIVEILQQQNAEDFNAVVKANCGTIQTLIQAELADSDYKTVKGYVVDSSLNGLFSKSGIKNPGNGAQTKNGIAGEAGCVVVTFDDALKVFSINGNAFVTGSVLIKPLIARY